MLQPKYLEQTRVEQSEAESCKNMLNYRKETLLGQLEQYKLT